MENEIKNNQEEEHLTKSERKKLKRERKQTERAQERKSGSIKKISIWAALALIIVLLIMWFANQKVLPPTTMQGHIEVSPESHFVTEPMDIRVHKHMLEHADGTGPAGIILNYNCDDFTCEDDFLDNLRKIVGEYPSIEDLRSLEDTSGSAII